MDTGPGSTLRWFRALVLGSVVLACGSVGHATAGGNLPGIPALVAAGALCVLVSATLLERPASTGGVVALTVSGQALVHAWLTLAAGHGGTHATAQDPMAHLLADLAPANAPMMLAHALAAAAVGLWLAAGERALWAVLAITCAALVVLLGRLAPVLAAPGLSRVPPGTGAARRPALQLLAPSVVRRGPPVLLAA